MGLWDALAKLMFPPKCPFCGRVLPGEEDCVCEKCRKTLPWADNRDRRANFIKDMTAPFYYEGEVRRSLLEFKFHANPGRARAFGRLTARALSERGVAFDVLTWVPLSAKRLRSRGYDQARLLAEGAAEELHTEAVSLLTKVRDVSPQSRIKSPEERRANISGCYAVNDPSVVAGKRILIIDDIITTGSTVSECARMLLMAGAESVRAGAVACHRDR